MGPVYVSDGRKAKMLVWLNMTIYIADMCVCACILYQTSDVFTLQSLDHT